MKVKCQNCQENFEVPLLSGGAIDYAQCKNVFRVSYRFRTPCPGCKQILQLVPAGSKNAHGISIDFVPNEETERVELSPQADATIPRTLAAQVRPRQAPTVTVRGPAKLKSSAFRMIDPPAKRPRAVHVPLRKSRPTKGSSVLKVFFAGVLGLSLTLTVTFTVFALKARKSSQARLPSPPAQTQTTNLLDNKGMGTKNENVTAEPETKPTPRPLITPKPQKETAEIHIPDLDHVTSEFGHRNDPFTHAKRFHGGIDIGVEKRSEVQAALQGKVRFVGRKGGYGNVVIIDHTDGYQTLYAHLTKPLVKKGERVRQGALVGLIGETGRATGPHLHFELWKNGKRIDPLRATYLAKAD